MAGRCPNVFPQIFSLIPAKLNYRRQLSESWRNSRSGYLRTDDIDALAVGGDYGINQVLADGAERARGILPSRSF